jgi:hypothetical protein
MTDEDANHGPWRRTAGIGKADRRGGPSPASVDPLHDTVERYRLAVVTADSTELVRSAGGYLFDRSFAGWDVDVTLPNERQDTTPLKVLGVRINEAAAEGFRLDPPVRILLIDPSLVETAGIEWAARRCDADILFTDPHPTRIRASVTRETHRLSSAARAFKTQALIVSGSPAAPMESVETFWRITEQPRRKPSHTNARG